VSDSERWLLLVCIVTLAIVAFVCVRLARWILATQLKDHARFKDHLASNPGFQRVILDQATGEITELRDGKWRVIVPARRLSTRWLWRVRVRPALEELARR
jgi:hypothetical protein